MLGEPLHNSKISERGMSDDNSKTFAIGERSIEHTQRVVLEDFDESLCSPCTDFDEDILCDVELNPSIHPTIQDTQEKTRKGERPKNSTGVAAIVANFSSIAIAANFSSANSSSVATAANFSSASSSSVATSEAAPISLV